MGGESMEINVLHGLAGAENARGLCVVIDVFRAFSLEAQIYAQGAEEIIPVGKIQEAFACKEEHPEYILAGERNGKMVEGFDFGNSPSAFAKEDIKGKTVVHTTSAGVQGLVAVMPHAEEVLTGALVNAEAIARYIQKKNPAVVSLVAMGWNGIRETEEDNLCADYLKSLLAGEPLADIQERAMGLKELEGKKFFNPDTQDIFPEPDFYACVRVDVYAGVIQVWQENGQLKTRWIQ